LFPFCGESLTQDFYTLANGVIFASVEPYALTLIASIDLDALNPLGDEVRTASGTDKDFPEATALLTGDSTRGRQQSGIQSG